MYSSKVLGVCNRKVGFDTKRIMSCLECLHVQRGQTFGGFHSAVMDFHIPKKETGYVNQPLCLNARKRQ